MPRVQSSSMVEPVPVPNLALVHLFRDVLEEEYMRAKKELREMDAELQGSFIRRLAAVCNAISEALIKSTAQMHQAYTGRTGAILQPPKLTKESKEPVDCEKQKESRKVQGDLARAVDTIRTQVREAASQLTAELQAASTIDLPADSRPAVPDIASELAGYTRTVAYERDLKAKAVSTLQQADFQPEAVPVSATAFESRIYSRLLWWV